MSYVKNTWNTGDTITATKMNNIEEGIKKLDDTIEADKLQLDKIEESVANNKAALETLKTITVKTLKIAITLNENQWVTPYTHHKSFFLDITDFYTQYGPITSISAIGNAGEPIPASFAHPSLNTSQPEPYFQVSGMHTNATLYINYLCTEETAEQEETV